MSPSLWAKLKKNIFQKIRQRVAPHRYYLLRPNLTIHHLAFFSHWHKTLQPTLGCSRNVMLASLVSTQLIKNTSVIKGWKALRSIYSKWRGIELRLKRIRKNYLSQLFYLQSSNVSNIDPYHLIFLLLWENSNIFWLFPV